MHKLRVLANEILEVYRESPDSFQSFQQKTGLTCLPDCGECCLSNQVSASILEMIPAALYLYDHHLADQIITTLEDFDDTNHCIFYIKLSTDGKKGRCSRYDLRPCICRSFGAAAIRGKTGKKILSVCKEIKKFTSLNLDHLDLSGAPVIGEFSSKILLKECSALTQVKPINQALYEALLKVLTVASYNQPTL
ncbi:MAG: hypothetical protein A2381_03355 [Bdellovibrionales bacterium RIFOXYB1_FULL_37_110]|nr:MAG: hypothetical protein A2181_00460 [Bdellovibrionales bacterium RIFOXYA1_FULL_38_20]OFZ48442.1 MAG: hypothetical protein A2417_03845 [Bdellovibrionales bacterium RIFOXYC1_FULL_37_79]OFZ57963.1 MAG: hypothetical protein A2381_03355 [Bdellovibrionales bacterium RIFOXYB1_FULL_37_110]OFZ63100.1 MAG: hypothetical protein A2577_15485 [Bdellovibrionales bacterium RIFOXYD1_FULL_36_51]